MRRLVGEGWDDPDGRIGLHTRAQEWCVGSTVTGLTVKVPQSTIDTLHRDVAEFLDRHSPDDPDGGELARLPSPDRPYPGGTEVPIAA